MKSLALILGLAMGWVLCTPLGPVFGFELETIGEEAFEAVKVFFDYDQSLPLDAKVVEHKDGETTLREKVVFRSVRGFLVPGYLEWPKLETGPFPVVLLLHGWSGSREHWWKEGGYLSGGNLREALLSKGYAVFALDAQVHGERMAENDYAMVNDYVPEGTPTHRNYFQLPEIYNQTVIDYRKGLDWLTTRAEIDMERVGVLGYSMGGTQTFLLTGLDDRIKTAVACVTPAMEEKYFPVAPKNYVRGIGNRPFLMLMGKTDTMCSVEFATALFESIPSLDKALIWYESGHKLPVEYVDDAVAWFEKRL